MLRRLYRATVWAPHGLDHVPEGYRGLFRWVLPLTDAFFFWFGAVGWWNGIATVETASSQGWQETWSAAIAVFALAAFIGVAFPRLWVLEMVSKLFLVGLISVYIAIFLGRGFADPLVAATAGLICVLILLPVWKLFRLSRQAATWWAARKARKRGLV
ncbi:hypothetical protein [Microbacterium sp. A1-JK]|uniref:hypothetical protein n=1 Tax=Microbacterium sp. A1-JK TaxID=3177516 RepID=UPI003883CFD0